MSRNRFIINLEASSPKRMKVSVDVQNLRDAAKALRQWVKGDNESGEFLGSSDLGKNCGRVVDAVSGKEVAMVSYNGRVWNKSGVEITEID